MREMCKGKRAEGIIKEMLEELEYLKGRVSKIEDDLDNIIAKVDDSELKKDLSYIYMQLEDLITELKDYCVGDCSICTKNCDIMCNVDCYQCVRFHKCLQEKKVSRMVFD